MTGQLTARRVRKARRMTACGMCGAMILAGCQEALIEPLDGRGPCRWVHVEPCLLQAQRAARDAAGTP